MSNSYTPHSVAVRKAATARCIQRAVDDGARRLGVLLPAPTAAKLKAIQRATGKSARKIVIDLIDEAGDNLVVPDKTNASV
jgi:hypothetical protein